MTDKHKAQESELTYELNAKITNEDGSASGYKKIIKKQPSDEKISHNGNISTIFGTFSGKIIHIFDKNDTIVMRFCNSKTEGELKIPFVQDITIPKESIEDVCEMLLQFKCEIFKNKTA